MFSIYILNAKFCKSYTIFMSICNITACMWISFTHLSEHATHKHFLGQSGPAGYSYTDWRNIISYCFETSLALKIMTLQHKQKYHIWVVVMRYVVTKVAIAGDARGWVRHYRRIRSFWIVYDQILYYTSDSNFQMKKGFIHITWWRDFYCYFALRVRYLEWNT